MTGADQDTTPAGCAAGNDHRAITPCGALAAVAAIAIPLSRGQKAAATRRRNALTRAAIRARAEHPDRELLAACAEFEAIERECAAWRSGAALSEEDGGALSGRWDAALRRVADLPSSTLRGLMAKVRVAQVVQRSGVDEDLWEETVPAVTLAVANDAAALLGGSIAADPDAELIALCDQHIANRDEYDRNTTEGDKNELLWAAYCRTRDAIDDARPQTLAGLAAKARATKAEATMPTGAEMFDGGPALRWVRDLVHDLLRLHGGAA